MRNPLVWISVALFLFAVENVILEQKLSKFHQLALMSIYTGVVFVLSVVTLLIHNRFTEEPLEMPGSGAALAFTILMGVLFFWADYFYVGAYHLKGDVFSLTTMAILMPVFAVIIKFAFTGSVPNGMQMIGFVFGGCTIYFIAKGSAAADTFWIPTTRMRERR